MIEPEFKVRLLASVSVPLAVVPVPPSKLAPKPTATVPPIVPVPPKVVPLLFTETAPVAAELLPLTNNVPAFTVAVSETASRRATVGNCSSNGDVASAVDDVDAVGCIVAQGVTAQRERVASAVHSGGLHRIRRVGHGATKVERAVCAVERDCLIARICYRARAEGQVICSCESEVTAKGDGIVVGQRKGASGRIVNRAAVNDEILACEEAVEGIGRAGRGTDQARDLSGRHCDRPEWWPLGLLMGNRT